MRCVQCFPTVDVYMLCNTNCKAQRPQCQLDNLHLYYIEEAIHSQARGINATSLSEPAQCRQQQYLSPYSFKWPLVILLSYIFSNHTCIATMSSYGHHILRGIDTALRIRICTIHASTARCCLANGQSCQYKLSHAILFHRYSMVRS